MLINVLYSLFYKWVIREECWSATSHVVFCDFDILPQHEAKDSSIVFSWIDYNCAAYQLLFVPTTLYLFLFNFVADSTEAMSLNLIAAIITNFDKWNAVFTFLPVELNGNKKYLIICAKYWPMTNTTIVQDHFAIFVGCSPPANISSNWIRAVFSQMAKQML